MKIKDNHTNKEAQIASLAAAVSWAYHHTDDADLRKTLRQVLRWHLALQDEQRAEKVTS